jgi:hypothetical protein
MSMKFEGTAEYVATPDLTVAVNAAIALERPLLPAAAPAPGNLRQDASVRPLQRLAVMAGGRRK